jgi:hypothetical protein
MADTLTYKTLKTANQAREAVSNGFRLNCIFVTYNILILKEELKTETRKKNLIILILHWMTEEGYLLRIFHLLTNEFLILFFI